MGWSGLLDLRSDSRCSWTVSAVCPLPDGRGDEADGWIERLIDGDDACNALEGNVWSENGRQTGFWLLMAV